MIKIIWITFLVFGAGLWTSGMENNNLVFAQEDVQPPSYVPINPETENGRTLSIQYKLKTAQKILGIWSLYEHALETDKAKMKYYDLSIAKKDALITDVYNLCSKSADRQNEFCQLYPELVRMLGPIPDKVPGKWMGQ